MKYLLFLFNSFMIFSSCGQDKPIGIFKFNTDIGNPKIPGSSSYNESSHIYTLSGSGYNIWAERDEFHFTYNKIKGDFILTANFKLQGKGTIPHRKTGWMLRATTDDNSPYISAALHGDGLTVMQWRDFPGALTEDNEVEAMLIGSGYDILQIERSGKKIFMRAAHTGKPFETIGSHEMINLPDEILAGLFICSHDINGIEEVTVWNIRIDKPAADN